MHVRKLSHAQGQLSGRMSMLGFSEQSHAMTASLASDLINSSEIEGVIRNNTFPILERP
ncbi:MAG: DUF4172 domain-containing protein [Muribaculaceae bacterium]|nr:DUF4172 domain-containing protein [Muribaculaceae bacterium]